MLVEDVDDRIDASLRSCTATSRSSARTTTMTVGIWLTLFCGVVVVVGQKADRRRVRCVIARPRGGLAGFRIQNAKTSAARPGTDGWRVHVSSWKDVD